MKEEKPKQYFIYKMHFFLAMERNMYNQNINAEANLKHAEECMKSLFDPHQVKGLYKMRKDKEPIVYPNDVMCPERWNIIWWRVNNVLFKKFVKRTHKDGNGIDVYEEDEQESNPFTNVVVDLRPDSLQIAIEKTSAWSNTDNLAKLIQDSFHRLLGNNFGIDIEIEPKMEATKFWDFVNKQLYENNDYVKKVLFTFANTRRVKGVSDKQIRSSRLKAMCKVAELSDAIKGCYTMEFNKSSDKKKFSENNRDVAEMVNLCCDEAFDIKVYFKHMKLYRIDENVKASFPMPQKHLHTFAQNSVNLNGTLDLIDWLDEVRVRIHKIDNERKTPTRSN